MSLRCCKRLMLKIHSKDIRLDEYGKAKEFCLMSIARPHMRAFHSSWFCFFIAFTAWFGIQPLLPTIIKELHLSRKDVANSGIASVAATIIVRVSAGHLCDKFGPRRVMATLLVIGSIPLALAGLITSGTGLIVVRLFIGFLGGTFVPCQFWTSIMFNYKIVGTANAMVGGWGNLGCGFTFLLMPAVFQLIKIMGVPEYLAWKIAVVVPAVICSVTGISILFTSDDCPQGEWRNRRHAHAKTEELRAVINEGENLPMKGHHKSHLNKQPKVWTYITISLLIVQYGMCFGVEIAGNTILNLYFLYKFKIEGCNETTVTISNSNSTGANFLDKGEVNLSCSVLNQSTASLIASLFGLMNLFARAMGGTFSDVCFKHFKIPGRLLAHQLCLAGEGIMLVIFSQMKSIPMAICTLVITSLFIQASEGTTYSIVPYVHAKRIGVIAGVVGAGGNTGALIWNTIWVQLVDVEPSWWFWIIGVIVFSGSMFTLLLRVEGMTIWHLLRKQEKRKNEENATALEQ